MEVTTRFPPRLQGLLLFLCLCGLLVWYQLPIICNPCTWPPTAATGVLVPSELIGVTVHYEAFDHFGSIDRWVSVYPNGLKERGYGVAYSADAISELITTAAEHHPGFPVVIKADEETPCALVHYILRDLQRSGFRQVYFEVGNPK